MRIHQGASYVAENFTVEELYVQKYNICQAHFLMYITFEVTTLHTVNKRLFLAYKLY